LGGGGDKKGIGALGWGGRGVPGKVDRGHLALGLGRMGKSEKASENSEKLDQENTE
jgi:hypothetical protein